jgi:hypothetical protein
MKAVILSLIISISAIATNAQSPFKSQTEVIQYMEGKTFVNNEMGLKITYGYISTANTYGIAVKNNKGATFYYINCRLKPYGIFCDIFGISPENGEDFGFRLFKDKLVVGYGQPQSQTFYLERK